MATSRRDRLIARFQRLSTDRHFRDTQREFVVESIRDIQAVLHGGLRVSAILVTSRTAKSSPVQRILNDERWKDVPILYASADAFSSFSATPSGCGIAAIVEMFRHCLDDYQSAGFRCWLAISRIRSTGNFGTLIRSAVAANVQGIFLIGQSADPFDPRVIRPAMGALLRIPVIRTSWPKLKNWAVMSGCEIVGACPSAKTDVWQQTLSPGTVFMLGEEGTGLSSRQKKACHKLVRIPMIRDSDSLNLGVAGSLLVYEFYRRFSSSETRP